MEKVFCVVLLLEDFSKLHGDVCSHTAGCFLPAGGAEVAALLLSSAFTTA